MLIPVLNGMPYLTETLASLQAQTVRDFEVTVWDNGSTDGTVEEARRWIPARLPGRVVADRPLPLHECLARMVEESTTEFCARLDADDVCRPERFAVQLQALATEPGLVAVGCQADYIDPDGQATGDGSDFPLEPCDVLAGLLVENQLLHPSILFRREAILKAGNYRIPKPCEDYDLWLRASFEGSLRNLPDRLLQYRIHPGSILAQARRDNLLEEPNVNCIAALSERRFSIPEATYRALRGKRHRMAVLPLLKAARSISRNSAVPLSRVLRSPAFLWSARCLTANRDRVSRAVWGTLQRLGPTTVGRV